METEDKHFFVPSMRYFSVVEQADMMRAFAEFDAKLVHEKYKLLIEDMEQAQGS
jgi:hypothetical protein